MLSKIKLMDLVGIAGFVGIIGSGSLIILTNRLRNRILREDYCVQAFKVLEQNSAAMDLIGSPLRKYKMDLSDTKNNCFESLSTRVKVPFKGSKRKGDLFVWAERTDIQNQWTLRRLEIIFDDIKDKKVIVYKTQSKE